MLVSEVMVISTLKILNGISIELMECLNEGAKKEKRTLSVHQGGIQITTGSNLHDTSYISMSFMDLMMI